MSKNLGEVEKLKSQIHAFEEGIEQYASELKKKQDSKKQLIDSLNVIRCKIILREIDRIVKDFLKLQGPFEALKARAIEIQASDSAWWQLPQKLGEDSVYTEVVASEFKADRINSLELLQFIQKVRTFSVLRKDALFKFK